ncbi:MAG TPA: putative 2OG-Fe(II) oxygenase [Caulobacteraceae bacterium]
MISAEALELAKAKLLAAAEAMAEPTPAVLLTRAERRLAAGDAAEAARLAWQAYGLDPSLDQFALLFPDVEGSPEASLGKARALVAAGFHNARLTEIIAFAATRLGRFGDIRALMDQDRFLAVVRAAAPDDPDLPELAQALQTDLAHYRSPAYRAIRHAARREGVDEATDGPPALARMFERLRSAVGGWIAALPADPAHPFLAGKPERFRLEGWSVVSGRKGHHTPHVHTESWANGVFYVQVPDAVENAEKRAGWLRVGPPADYGVGDAEGWPERWIQPRPGLAVIMPSHFHHETRPLGADQTRICFAFQIYPLPAV